MSLDAVIPSETRQRERLQTDVFPSADAAVEQVAQQIIALISDNNAKSQRTVLGLATGSSPVRLYRRLVRAHREQGLSFARVVTFNLDEYYGLPREHPESYWRFMHDHLFDHLDIPAESIHVPDGTIPRPEVFAWCRAYEEKIASFGGIDLQILGIGRTGHIGFNEPGSGRDSRTRLVTLDQLTRRDAARDFLGEAHVPRHAITMGIRTILDAREIVLLAWGEAKAPVVADAVEKCPSESLPASLLQGHSRVRFVIDPAAASRLTRIRHPWLVGPVEWYPALTRRAVLWLCREVNKPVLKLRDEDYTERGMADLITEHGSAYALNIRIFNELQRTITGWPGGKLNADDSQRPERRSPYPKRALILSPEPSHDILGMGGTLRRLQEQGHDVHVLYLTSGNLAVPDTEIRMAAELIADFGEALQSSDPRTQNLAPLVRKQLEVADEAAIRRLKGQLRRAEARASARDCGLDEPQLQFLDLPFYERGRYRRFAPDERDVDQVVNSLRAFKPHQVFLTGDRDDPSSLAAVEFEILRKAQAKLVREDWIHDCRFWLYRGVDTPWEVAEIDMAVPISPGELERKTEAIFRHRSQRNQTPMATGLREPWQQAENLNRELAATYDALGLANYEALEGFQRWNPAPHSP